MVDAQRDALLTILLTPGLGTTLAARAVETLGGPQAVVEADAQALAAVRGIALPKAGRICRAMDEIRSNGVLEQEHELIERHGVQLIARDDPQYPRLLKLIPDPPALLYIRGDLQEEDSLALAIVGARRCTGYGREQADRFATQAVAAGLGVVSGGAFGIDATAHQAALRSGGRTICVIGSGLAKPYPDRHIELYDMIADGHGAVISEFPMTVPPVPENFPRRNRIVSGLALGVLVIEAALRSGALITARLCVEEHGRECMALPGRVDSQASAGCHKLIRDGAATLVTSMTDVLDILGEAGTMLRSDAEARGWSTPEPNLFEQNLSESQQRLIDALDEPRDLDGLAAMTDLPVHVVNADLTMLQIRGLIAREHGLYRRKR